MDVAAVKELAEKIKAGQAEKAKAADAEVWAEREKYRDQLVHAIEVLRDREFTPEQVKALGLEVATQFIGGDYLDSSMRTVQTHEGWTGQLRASMPEKGKRMEVLISIGAERIEYFNGTEEPIICNAEIYGVLFVEPGMNSDVPQYRYPEKGLTWAESIILWAAEWAQELAAA